MRRHRGKPIMSPTSTGSRPLPASVPNRPTESGKDLGKCFSAFTDAEIEKRGEGDDRCTTCAFRAGTIPNGCEATLMDAAKCLLEMNPFLCHEPRPHTDGGEKVLCAGFSALLSSLPPDAKRTKAPWDYSYESEISQ